MHSMQTTNDTQPTTAPTIDGATVEATIDRYLVMFNEADDAARAAQAHDVWVDDGRLVDPLIDAIGPDRSPPPSASCATRCPATS